MPHELELLQPLDRGLRDYALRVADAIFLLAKVEDRSELDILREVSTSTWDVHTLRLFPADEPAGLIGLEDGVLAYECLRSLVSAACSWRFDSTLGSPEPTSIAIA